VTECFRVFIFWPFIGQIKLKNCNEQLNICLLFAVVIWPSRKYKFSFLPAIIKQLERRPQLPAKGPKSKGKGISAQKIHFIFTSIAEYLPVCQFAVAVFVSAARSLL